MRGSLPSARLRRLPRRDLARDPLPLGVLPDDVLDRRPPGLLLQAQDEVRPHPVLFGADVKAAAVELEGVEGALLEEDARAASVSWTSPFLPGRVFSIASKMSGVRA